MATSRTKKRGAGGRKPHFTRARPAVKKPAAPARGAVAKRRPALPPQATETPRRPKVRVRLPGWNELAEGNAPAPGRRKQPALDTLSTARFGLFILALAMAFTLYVGHVHASQALLTEVQELRRQNLSLHLKYNRLKGSFDQMTSPARIYERARALGLVEAPRYGTTITLER